eukprot:gene2705-biopygen2669
MPALMPGGGSLVTLMDICKSPMGNFAWGSDVMRMRASSPIASASSLTSVVSRSLRKLRPRWQFCSRAHSPVPARAAIAASMAACSWPCPIEIPPCGMICFFRFFADVSISALGSDPCDSKKMIGVLPVVWSITASKSS